MIECEHCGTKIPPRRGRRGNPRRFCDDSCRGKYRRARGTQKRCAWCDSPFQANADRTTFCSRRCLNRANRSSGHASMIPWAECRVCATWFVAHRGTTYCSTGCHPRSSPLICRDCGAPRRRYATYCQPCAAAREEQRQAALRPELIAWRRDNRAAYKAADRARRRGAKTAEVIDPADIYERDRYRCGICGRRLAMNKSFPHPQSPTLDHMVPIAAGGLHESRNVQAAHMICNSVKSDDAANDQLRLIG